MGTLMRTGLQGPHFRFSLPQTGGFEPTFISGLLMILAAFCLRMLVAFSVYKIEVMVLLNIYGVRICQFTVLLSQAEASALQIGSSSSTFGGILRMGFLSKKFTGFRSKLDDTVGMIGKSS
ncbi:tubby like protein 2 [Striga asiatica]|uniref:Tubby like protein 2 n=1 Tax=Striga asiatica TaxID=4170 RepID=A0A5A7P5P8_STRAF|nr:tubby like protein 2 [Striga asiatica]